MYKKSSVFQRIKIATQVCSFMGLFVMLPQLVLCKTKNKLPEQNLAIQIVDSYIKSFASELSGEKEGIAEEAIKSHPAYQARPAKLDAATKRKVVFRKILTNSQKFSCVQQQMESILNEYAWNDLKLFYGTTSEPGYHLLSRINRTTTTLGEVALASLLVTPTSNLTLLHQRQAILKFFLKNPSAATQLKNRLKSYHHSEQSMLSLWTDTDPLYSKEYRTYMDQKFYAEGNNASNKPVAWLEFKKRLLRDWGNIQFHFLYPALKPIIGEIFFRDRLQIYENRKKIWIDAIPYYGAWYTWTKQIAANKIYKDISGWLAVPLVLRETFYTWNIYWGASNYLEYSAALHHLALRMADLQAFIITAHQLSHTIAASPALEEAYGQHLVGVRQLLSQANEPTELGKLIYYLQHLPFNHWSYFFNNAGQLLASHKLFIEYKEAFSDAIYEVGLLDAYLSFVTLMQEAQHYDNQHSYVFAQFLNRQQKTKPYIQIKDMWNPFLDAKQAVSNSLEMDAAPGGVRNIILTGPNAGGKSTFLTGVTHALLLAHVVGIAPAQSITLTPFNKINTYIDIADDIAAGKSLFMAEVDRAQKHIKILQNLKSNEFSFTIFDEPFSGTNPTEGAAAEYSILESLADYTNSLNIVATHYPTVMLLEEKIKGKGFANYKVYITRKGAQGKLNYTYKIMPGKSNQAIAIDILAEQGYNTQMLKRAREIIEHPERYRASF